MVAHSHRVSVLLEQFKGLIRFQEVGNDAADDGAEFEAVARAGGNNEHVLVFIGPVDQEIFIFGAGVVAIFQFFQFDIPSRKMRFDFSNQLIHFLFDVIFLCIFLAVFLFAVMDSKFHSIALYIWKSKHLQFLLFVAPAGEFGLLILFGVFHLPEGDYLAD